MPTITHQHLEIVAAALLTAGYAAMMVAIALRLWH
jgi:hypothetical protein